MGKESGIKQGPLPLVLNTIHMPDMCDPNYMPEPVKCFFSKKVKTFILSLIVCVYTPTYAVE